MRNKPYISLPFNMYLLVHYYANEHINRVNQHTMLQ